MIDYSMAQSLRILTYVNLKIHFHRINTWSHVPDSDNSSGIISCILWVCYKNNVYFSNVFKKNSFFTIFKKNYSTLHSQIRDSTSADIHHQGCQAPSGTALLFSTNKHCIKMYYSKMRLICYTAILGYLELFTVCTFRQ